MQSIKTLTGVGDKRAKLFEKKGIFTVSDLLGLYPRDYEDRTNKKDIICCMPGESVLVNATVLTRVNEKKIRKGMTIYQMVVGDDTAIMTITWYNNRFVKNIFRIGDRYVFFGKISPHSAKKEMVNPVFEQEVKEKFTQSIVPIYPLWQGVTQKLIGTMMKEALLKRGEVTEYIPNDIRKENGVCDINYALRNIHFPKTFDDFEKARKRLVFEELLFLQLALLYKKQKQEKIRRNPFKDLSYTQEFVNSLPFEMTNAQKNVLEEIKKDLSKDIPMNRLVQGDVGSGKTVVAAAAMYTAVKNGYQTAIMAPTEILASQHYETFLSLFEKTDVKICLLCGSTKRKKDLYEKIENGEYDIIIGTHALIQEAVIYKNLGLVITDEQHRFGVVQRAKLSLKGEGVHTLVMTATPIPRTLAFILYGDLDISIIDELPPGRKTVLTYAVGEDMRKRIYKFLEKNLQNGTQCYVVCPLIEETENSDLENATKIYQQMSVLFSDYKVGLIHGKMKACEKDDVMNEFAQGNIHILVSTTVIEVGVNVPNANIMVIENSERFGLSQLHQLRGRVGRGNEQAYCILFAHGGSDVIKKRMETMCKTNDGFKISEEDLKLRGPGDFFGTRQHGLPELKIANLFSDMKLLKAAQTTAQKIITKDPKLETSDFLGMKNKILEMFREEIAMN